MVKYNDRHLNRIFSALADSTRRDIITRLSHGTASVTEIARAYEISLPAVSKHIKILESAGLVIRERHGRMHSLSLQSLSLGPALTWLEYYRQFWEKNFDSLERHLSSHHKP